MIYKERIIKFLVDNPYVGSIALIRLLRENHFDEDPLIIKGVCKKGCCSCEIACDPKKDPPEFIFECNNLRTPKDKMIEKIIEILNESLCKGCKHQEGLSNYCYECFRINGNKEDIINKIKV